MAGARQAIAGVVPGSKGFPVGIWSDATPPGLNLLPYDHTASYGIPWVEVSPINNNIVYCCCDQKGLWKSTDAGHTWALVGGTITPGNFTASTTYFDSPIAVRIDPGNANNLYVTQGVRGSTQGFWKSTDGGVNWTLPTGFDTASSPTGTRDCTLIATDPADFTNILVSAHQSWSGLGFSNNGFYHSTDGGTTWARVNPNAAWTGGSLGLTFLHDPPSGQGNASTWLVGSDSAGLWRTTNAGSTWTQVSATNGPVHGGHVCYYDSTGRLWAGAGSYPMYSNDNGVTWTQPTTGLVNGSSYYNIISDGVKLYGSPSYTGDNGTLTPQPFFTSLVSDGNTWTQFNGGAQTFTDGPFVMRFAPQYNRIYAACWSAGLKVLQL